METNSTVITPATPAAPLTIKQRFLADTPTLFKVTQLIGVVLMVIVSLLISNGIIPVKDPIALYVGGIGTTMAVVSSFVVKDFSALSQSGFTLDSLIALIPQLSDQFKQVKVTANSQFVPAKDSESGVDELQTATNLVATDPVVQSVDPNIKTQLATGVTDLKAAEKVVTELKAPTTI
jgi:hypothetical protein